MTPEDQELLDLERQMEQAAQVDGPAPEPEVEPAPSPPSEPEPQPVVEEMATPAPAEPAADPTPTEADILKAELEEAKARMRHFESLAGRVAGSQGYIGQLKGEIANLQRTVESLRTGEEPPPQSVVEQPNDLRSWAVNDALQKARNEFAAAHKDFDELQPAMAKYFADAGLQASGSQDPNQVYREVTGFLNEAYSHAVAQKAAAITENLRVKVAEQTKKALEARKNASVSGSGGSAPPPPKQRSEGDLSLDELDREMVRLTQGRW